MALILDKARKAVKDGKGLAILPLVFQAREKSAQLQCGGRYARYPKKV